jgi:purine nucleosidase
VSGGGGFGAEANPARRLIVDTDTAGDDVFSLLIALRHPEVQLEAITVCVGNVRFEQEVENALYTVEVAGRSGEVPVYAGCAEPLIADWVGAEYVHGEDGMGDSNFARARQRPEPEHAVDELVRRVNESPGELTILAQAPLTNLAAAVTRDPSIAQKVAHLYVMGGGIGNITPAAEYNFYVDPEAAKIVVDAGFPMTLFTWSLTRTHGVFDDDKLARIAALGTPLAEFFGQVNRKAREFDDKVNRLGGSTHPDSMVAAAIVEPSLVLAAEDAVVDVETSGELTRGWSLIDTLGRTEREPNARVVTNYDTEAFFELMLSVLA